VPLHKKTVVVMNVQTKSAWIGSLKLYALVGLVVILAAFIAFWHYRFTFPVKHYSSTQNRTAEVGSGLESGSSNSAAVPRVVTQLPAPDTTPAVAESAQITQEPSSFRSIITAAQVLASDWDGVLSDEQFTELVSQLKSDADLLDQFLDKFRQETDPLRRQLLAHVLAKVGGEKVTLAATELVFSGDEQSRSQGLKMLQDVQPGNAEVRDLVSGMLATEVQPQILKDTLSVLSRTGNVDLQSRAYLADQVSWLTTHQDAGVRGVSLDILSRWSVDGRYTDALLTGLSDEAESVRSSAAYALVDHEDQSPVVVQRLFDIMQNTDELKSVKQAAILALRSMPLSPQQLDELNTLERRLNTRRR